MEKIYFIKHKGMSPIKIGRTIDLTNRLIAFNNASPYGIEVLGVIETNDSIKLEKIIHKKFNSFRLNGEWFSITEQQANDFIFLFKDKDYIDEKNYLEIRHSKINSRIRKTSYDINDASPILTDKFLHKIVINRAEFMQLFNCNKNEFSDFVRFNDLKYKSYRDGVKVKSGLVIYTTTLIYERFDKIKLK